ncbi:MAG: 4Fe-4S binding protein [Alphaproteobacteria bacterium]|nr:4Fe-4S binding protein [Alphaproteobacteria bacterium]
MAYKIDSNKCIGCHSCTAICPMMAIAIQSNGKCAIDPAKCVSCGTCASVCPVAAIAPAQ